MRRNAKQANDGSEAKTGKSQRAEASAGAAIAGEASMAVVSTRTNESAFWYTYGNYADESVR